MRSEHLSEVINFDNEWSAKREKLSVSGTCKNETARDTVRDCERAHGSTKLHGEKELVKSDTPTR